MGGGIGVPFNSQLFDEVVPVNETTTETEKEIIGQNRTLRMLFEYFWGSLTEASDEIHSTCKQPVAVEKELLCNELADTLQKIFRIDGLSEDVGAAFARLVSGAAVNSAAAAVSKFHEEIQSKESSTDPNHIPVWCDDTDFWYYRHTQRRVTENTLKLKRLQHLHPFVLDNSIRETTVGQIRGHVKEDKYAIWEAVKDAGINNCIVATFGSQPSVEDQWLEEIKEKRLLKNTDCSCYAFSELFEKVDAAGCPVEDDPVGLAKIKRYGIPNVVFEFDVDTPLLRFQDSGGSWTINNHAHLMQRKIENMKLHNPHAKIFFNFRDAPLAFRNPLAAVRMIAWVKYLARLSPHLRPFGIIFEEPGGEFFPWDIVDVTQTLRRTMVDNNWQAGHLLIHVHKNFGLAEAVVLEALSHGCTGIWAAVSEDGAMTGHACSLLTLTNLKRLGNKHMPSFNYFKLYSAAKIVCERATGQPPNPMQELYGSRAMDIVFSPGAMGDPQFDVAAFFQIKQNIRATTFTTATMFQKMLSITFGRDPTDYDIIICQRMQESVRDDLILGNKYEYQSPLGLYDLYQKAGGTAYLPEMVEICATDAPAARPDHILNELYNVVKSYSVSTTQPDGHSLFVRRQAEVSLTYTQFYNAFLAKYISCYSCDKARLVMAALDVDKSGAISWNELKANAQWALDQFEPESEAWNVGTLIEVVLEKRLLPMAYSNIYRNKQIRV